MLLVVRFTLPTINAESTEDILNLITHNDLSAITNEFVWGATLGNTIFQCIDELLVRFDAMDVSNLSVNPNKDDCGNGSIINSGNISINNITSD